MSTTSSAAEKSSQAIDTFPSVVWDDLSDAVDRLIAAWEGTHEPPPLAPLVTSPEASIRRLMLTELIKVDLEYRFKPPLRKKILEAYAAEFPGLVVDGRYPADLIYEEFHIRRQAGEDVEVDEYCQRFPRQTDEVRRLLKLESPHVSTTLAGQAHRAPGALGTSIDDFDLLAELGRGAFASVHLARQRSMQRIVALKVSADKGEEAQTLAQLDHPHIVRVYDQRRLPERKLRLVYMQYVAGGTLDDIVRQVVKPVATQPGGVAMLTGKNYLKAIDTSLELRGDSAPSESSTRRKLAQATWPEVVCWLGSKLAGALEHAHGMGVLHRDIKPANVLLAADGGPKLADFNISFSSKLDGATPAAYFGGSLAYMSVEQLEACSPKHEREAGSLDGRADQFSLAVMLWELLAGSRPFVDPPAQPQWAEVVDAMLQRRRAPLEERALRSLPMGCPVGLKETLLRALHPEAEQRFATASEFGRQLDLCLQPRAQSLLRGSQNAWRTLIGKYPAVVASLLVVLVHGCMSTFNIGYNFLELVRFLGLSAAEIFFRWQITLINVVAYGGGTAWMMWLALPVFNAVTTGAPPVAAEKLPLLRERCLRLGDYLRRMGLALWAISGIVIPGWLYIADREHTLAEWVGPFFHFMISQMLSGVIAATLSSFVLTFLAVRYFYPRLLTQALPPPNEAAQLNRLSRGLWISYLLAISVPLLAVVLVVFIDTQKMLIASLAGIGLVSFLLSFAMDRAIRGDLATLAQIVNPGGESLSSVQESGDSFWAGTR